MKELMKKRIRFENMMLRDTTSWWPCTKDKENKLFLSLNTILHFIYMYGSFDMAECCTVGVDTISYGGRDVAKFEMSEKYKIPVFEFIDEYKWMGENQDILLKGIEEGEHIKWRKKYEHLKDFLKYNF